MASRTARELLTVTNRAKQQPDSRSWYRIGNRYQVKNAAGKEIEGAEVWIYDEIGFWGVTASDFARDLSDLDVGEITVRLNSPGGEVYDGIAIMNALMDHKAKVTVKVDALAASIASVIAMAGDEIVMGAHSEFMIHDASTLGIGNAADLREVADMLDRVSDNIAEVYSERAGGTPKEWRDRMLAETWFTASEAVAVGLADKVQAKPKRRDPDGTEEDDEDPIEDHARRARARFDLSGYRYQNRHQAPAPKVAKKDDDEEKPPFEEEDPEEDAPDDVVDCDHVDYREDCDACAKKKAEQDSTEEEPMDFSGIGELFSAAFRAAAEPEVEVDASIFHHAIKNITDAAVPEPPKPAPVVTAPPTLFPADSVETVPPPVDPEFAGLDPEIFRQAVLLAANDAPAVPVRREESKTDPIPEFVIDPSEFYNSLREAI